MPINCQKFGGEGWVVQSSLATRCGLRGGPFLIFSDKVGGVKDNPFGLSKERQSSPVHSNR